MIARVPDSLLAAVDPDWFWARVSGVSQRQHSSPICHPVWKLNGFRKAQTKLSGDQIRELRARYAAGGVSQRALAAEYDISQGYLSAVVSCKERRLDL